MYDLSYRDQSLDENIDENELRMNEHAQNDMNAQNEMNELNDVSMDRMNEHSVDELDEIRMSEDEVMDEYDALSEENLKKKMVS